MKVILRLCFLITDLCFHYLERVRLKMDVQGQKGGRILNVDGQGGCGVLRSRQFSWMSNVCHP